MRAALYGLCLVVSLTLFPSGSPTPAQAAEEGARDAAPYQIVKATDQRVWRLDRTTGVISVCTLSGDRLICTDSTDAARPSAQEYEALRKAEAERDAAERERTLAFMDRLFGLFREVVTFASSEE